MDEHLEPHKAWVAKGFDDGVFVLSGGEKPRAGGQVVDAGSHAPIGVLDLATNMDFTATLLGRTGNQTGSFVASVNLASFTGNFLGHVVGVSLPGAPAPPPL